MTTEYLGNIINLIELSLGDFRAMGGKGSGHWRHKGRKGKRGGSAPSKGGTPAKGKGRIVSTQKGRQDRRVGDSYKFESKIVKPLPRHEQQTVYKELDYMEGGPKGYRDAGGVSRSTSTVQKRITWARDAGLLEKVGTKYELTPLGKSIADKGISNYRDHIALMTGDQSLMVKPFADSKAVGHWLYANWPENTSRVSRGAVAWEWGKVTGYRFGRFEVALAKQEQTYTKGKVSAVWERVADLDQVGLNPGLNRKDFV